MNVLAKTLKEKRELLAIIESELKAAMSQPGCKWFALKKERDDLRDEIDALDQPQDEEGCIAYANYYA